MGTQIVVPSPQHRYLEPFKNRCFQYDTKHSNVFLSHYVNQILNAVGDDSIVRGLEVAPKVNSSKTGIDFKISPGALIQDLTYFEFQNESTVSMEEVGDFSEYYIIIYTSYRYIETVYDNSMKFEGTLYNPRTKKALSIWNPAVNRIILGVYSFTAVDGFITDVTEIDSTIFFDEANVIRNGIFDTEGTDYWTAINSILHVKNDGGALDSPYVEVTPVSNTYQGIAQAFTTKPNLTYEVSFYVKSDESVPFQALILDKDSVYNINAPKIKSYDATSTKTWTLHTFRFTAFSNQTTIFLLKKSSSLTNKINFDHIYIFEYTPTRRRCNLHNISMVDGGRIPTIENLIPLRAAESVVYRWNIKYSTSNSIYEIDSTQPPLMNPSKGQYIVFCGGNYVEKDGYYIDWKRNKIYLYSTPEGSPSTISIYFLLYSSTSKYSWTIHLKDNLNIYSPGEDQEPFQNKANGQYFVFYNGSKLDDSYYNINYSRNTVQFTASAVNSFISKNVYISFITDPTVIKTWSFLSSAGVNAYYLVSSDDSFLDESNGKYLVFLGNKKLQEEDYLIKPTEGVITLDSSVIPLQNNIPLKIYYFGNSEPVDLTPPDKDFDVYKWTFILKSGKTSYVVDSSRDPFKPVNDGSYFAFKNGNHLSPNQYAISPTTGIVTFQSSAIQNNAVVEIYFSKKNPSAKYEWTFQATEEGLRSYTPASGKPAFQNPRNGMYLVFLGTKQLAKTQYTVQHGSNTIQISDSVSVPKNTRMQVVFISNPVPYSSWSFETVANVDVYTPKESEGRFFNFENGEYLLFINGVKIDSNKYTVNPFRDNISFTVSPSPGGEKCELYYVGRE